MAILKDNSRCDRPRSAVLRPDYGDVHRAPLVRGLRSCIAAARHRDFIIVGIVGSSAIIANQWWKRSSGRGAAAVARIYGATTRRS